MFRQLKRWLGLPESALDIQCSSDWRETRTDTRWRFGEETDHGIKIIREKAKQYEHMHTGESAELVRVDTEAEWYRWDEDWPHHAKRAYVDDVVWWDDIKDESDRYPPCWGMLMSKGGSTWRRVD